VTGGSVPDGSLAAGIARILPMFGKSTPILPNLGKTGKPRGKAARPHFLLLTS
jgi:hypothetical protein